VSQCFADRLTDAVIAKRVPAVVNIDPVADRLPAEFAASGSSGRPTNPAAMHQCLRDFGREVIDIVAPIVPVVKINIAYFEPYHAAGIEAYDELVGHALRQGLIVIGDVKRGDVGHTAERYARAQLSEQESPTPKGPDAVTVSGYFGWDGVRPFIEVARDEGKGVFVLVRTSNDSAASVQDILTQDGGKVHEVIAALVTRWAEDSGTLGRSGYTSVGAVVATRSAEDAARLRANMPRSIFLVPGYGAQGGKAEDFKPYFKEDGTGAIVAAGRSIIYAHDRAQYREQFGSDWRRCVEQACRDFVADLRTCLKSQESEPRP